jgi:hypothetical protein
MFQKNILKFIFVYDFGRVISVLKQCFATGNNIIHPPVIRNIFYNFGSTPRKLVNLSGTSLLKSSHDGSTLLKIKKAAWEPPLEFWVSIVLGFDDVDASAGHLDDAIGGRENGVVSAHTDVIAGEEFCAALAHNDIAGDDGLAA